MKKGFVAFLLFLIVALAVHAQDAPLDSLEKDTQSIVPPSLPSEEGSINLGNTYLILRDANTKEVIKNVHVFLEITGADGFSQHLLHYVDDAGSITLKLDEQQYEITAKANLLNTSGNDYFVSRTINPKVDKQYILYFLPVGSVQGTVNAINGNIVPKAHIKVQCAAQYGDLEEISTDEYGAFIAGWLPLGDCRVMAFSDKYIGYSEVTITQGSSQKVSIILDKEKVTKNTFLLFIAVISLALILGIVFFVQFKKMKQQKQKLDEFFVLEKKEESKIQVLEKELQKEKIKQRTHDVLETLKDREREITEYLLKNNFESTQAKLKHALRIPKTSLSRIFDSLAKKKVISIEVQGKLKKIKLTPWFLGEE